MGPKDLDSAVGAVHICMCVCVCVCMCMRVCVNISACVYSSSCFHAPQSVLAGPLIGSR